VEILPLPQARLIFMLGDLKYLHLLPHQVQDYTL